ncbi:SMC-Scp complex subunit ScpB [Inmirania thermothiophila]|uniref:Segregation and condensation protein B n=1 Tax=Inmirania thermothiophila TaxID=1750597 RepID=A0A3N1Y090_9GAMM|nr:SMC-Scp complex subunit ScpB [Inmirania thermothiophila]ROR32263.1 segregation and condensation protein B [Inmirania thermothiophila]
MDAARLRNILEAALLAAGRPLSLDALAALFAEHERPPRGQLRACLEALAEEYAGRAVELKEVASGWRVQVRADYAPWVQRLWEERPARYSRALLETLALIAYRQPITRGEIEAIRGVAVSSNIIRTLLDRGWIRVVGHRDAPGRPALFGTTRAFLDHFNLRSLDELPTLAELRDLDAVEPELPLAGPAPADHDGG